MKEIGEKMADGKGPIGDSQPGRVTSISHASDATIFQDDVSRATRSAQTNQGFQNMVDTNWDWPRHGQKVVVKQPECDESAAKGKEEGLRLRPS